MHTVLPNLLGTSVIGTLKHELVVLEWRAVLVVEIVVDIAIIKLVVEDELFLAVVPILPMYLKSLVLATVNKGMLQHIKGN